MARFTTKRHKITGKLYDGSNDPISMEWIKSDELSANSEIKSNMFISL